MKKTGEILRAEREKKGLSLHEVGMGLKINPKILKAIEEGDQKNLPAKTFLRGFVRSYAQYLRLDMDYVLKMFHEEAGSTRPEEIKPPVVESPTIEVDEVPAAKSKPSKAERKSFETNEGLTSKKIYSIVGSIVLFLLIIFVAKMVDKYQKESKRVKVETPNPILAEETPTADTDSPAPVDSLMTPMSSASPTPEATISPTPSPTAIATPSPSPTATPKPSPTPTPNTTPSPTPTESPSPTPAAVKTTEVIIEALNKVTIRYSFGDEKYESLSLMPDEFHTFKSKGALLLEISDGGAINIIVNGRDRGVPGTIGKPIKLSYPK